MTKRPTDGIRRLCGIVEGMRDNEFAEATVRKAAVAEECDRLDEAVGAVWQDMWDEGFEAEREWSIEDREAAEWVRDHGGLDAVKKLLDWVIGHCSTRQQLDFDFWLSGRVMHELGFDEDMADRDEVERRLLARLMPEGYEWPRYEDGKPVKPGSWLQDNDGEAFEAVSFVFTCAWWGIRGYRPDRYGTIGTKYRRQLDGMAYGAPVKRPAVLAADGEPLEGGQTVWHIETGADYWVKSGQTITADAVVIIRKTDCDCESEIVKASQLTHTKPEIDSWERLKSDIYKEIEMQPTLRTTKCGIESFVSDVVRRAKALAERDA